jgi:maltodextrin utilization protein YvdJ
MSKLVFLLFFMISPNQLVYRLTPDIQDVEGFQTINNQNQYEHISELDDNTITFAHKLGVVVESEYTLRVSVTTNQRGREYVYFIVPMEIDDE